MSDTMQVSLFEEARQKRISQWIQAAHAYPGGRRRMLVPPRSYEQEIALAAERLDAFLSSEEGKAALGLLAAADVRHWLGEYRIILEWTPGGALPLRSRYITFYLSGMGIARYDDQEHVRAVRGAELEEMFRCSRFGNIRPSKFVPALRRVLNTIAKHPAQRQLSS